MTRRHRRQAAEPEGAGERLTLTLTGMGHHGLALGRRGEEVVLVAGGIPGETVEAEVTRRHRDYLEARVVAVVEPSPDRVTPPCPYYGDCGGCQYQHIAYDRQLALKRGVVEDALRRIGKFAAAPVVDTLAAPSQWNYRNHARFTVNREGLLGFVRPNTHRCIPLDACMLLAEPMNDLLNQLRGHCAETRQVSLRYGINTGEYLVQPPIKNPVLRLATGQTSYHEDLGGHRFRVASPSFFQVNTAQAEQLAGLLRDFLGAAPVGLLVDAYAGVGAFAVLLAERCRRVIAVEESGPAVRDGRANSVRTPQVEWVQGKVEEVLPGLPDPPDVVLLDPPRAGCHPDVLAALAEHRPARLAYVSCDPATLARDLRVLVDSGFRLLQVQPVDMFPNTYHVEALATLEWRGVGG